MMQQPTIKDALKLVINNKTKPPGSLGRLEEIALQVGNIQSTIHPCIAAPHVVVFAADHGIAKAGLVNSYPQAVTGQMVLNFINGGAAINVFCRQNNIHLKVIDAGVDFDFTALYNEDFINAKLGRGTNDYSRGDAMTLQQALLAIEKGRNVVSAIASQSVCNCVGFGEMGIGNTSSASLIMSSMLELPVEDCVGRGTGADDEQLLTKLNTLEMVHAFHNLHEINNAPLKLLSRIGGFEIAQMVGAYLQAYEEKMIILVDGFISTAALLIARQMNPSITGNCIFAHTSSEKGHTAMLNFLQAVPLLNLGLRLGEGTGAALAIPLVQSSVNFLNEMATFETAGVNNKC